MRSRSTETELRELGSATSPAIYSCCLLHISILTLICDRGGCRDKDGCEAVTERKRAFGGGQDSTLKKAVSEQHRRKSASKI